MDYFVSTTDASINSLENLYTAPVKSVGYKLKVAALALFLIVSSMNKEAYGAESHSRQENQHTTEFVELWRDPFPATQLSGVEVTLDRTIYKIYASHASKFWQRQESLDKLRESFYANFNKGETDIDSFSPLFKTMANELSALKIDYSFVDVSRKKGMIDFNLNLEEGVFLSVAKHIVDQTDDVMFTIARNHKTIVIDEMPLRELMNKVTNVMTQLKTVGQS